MRNFVIVLLKFSPNLIHDEFDLSIGRGHYVDNFISYNILYIVIVFTLLYFSTIASGGYKTTIYNIILSFIFRDNTCKPFPVIIF